MVPFLFKEHSMKSNALFNQFYNFKGWVVESVELNLDNGSADIFLRLDGRNGLLQCPRCDYPRMGKMRTSYRDCRDLPLGTVNDVNIFFPCIQAKCSMCDFIHSFSPPGIESNGKATNRLKKYVSLLCRYMPANKVSSFIPISASTAVRWDKDILLKTLPEPCLDEIKVILIDETSIGRGYNFLTVVLNGDTGDVLHLAEGKKGECLMGFFDKLTDTQKVSIEAVGIDRAGSYQSVVKEVIPGADIVYDKFHIVSNFNGVIDDVRREEWRKTEGNDEKSFIKGQRFNLFRNIINLSVNQKASLKELLEANKDLNSVYLLKDTLKQLWTYTYRTSASKFLDKWIEMAKEADIDSLSRFARGLDKARDGLLNYCHHAITSSRIESFNATIKRIIRKACGYRDLEYLFLKIRQEGSNG
jgi:transposase